MGFLGGSVVKNPPAKAGDTGSIPGSGRCPGEGNYLSHSGNLAWEILWTAGPGGLQSMGLQRIGYNSVTKQQWMLQFLRCTGQPHHHQQTVPSASGESQEHEANPTCGWSLRTQVSIPETTYLGPFWGWYWELPNSPLYLLWLEVGVCPLQQKNPLSIDLCTDDHSSQILQAKKKKTNKGQC